MWLKAGKKLTFSDILLANKGLGPGFHLLRHALAILIVWNHSSWIVGIVHNDGGIGAGEPAQPLRHLSMYALSRPVVFSLVASFFVLSGFLVTGSAYRNRSVKVFLAFRIFRIVPALSVEVLLSAIILGAVFTKLSLIDYFTNSGTYAYFLNIVGIVHFQLPGVFTDHPVDRINANLWTLPAEFYCYLITIAAMLASVLYNRRLFTALVGIATCLMIVAEVFNYTDLRTNNTHYSSLLIVYDFFIGCALFMHRDRIPYRVDLFIGCTLAYYFLNYAQVSDVLAQIPLAYCTVFVGCTAFKWFDDLVPLDLSYGIYLYGFPMQQLVKELWPSLRSAPVLFVLALTLTVIFSIVSWQLIEKPALGLKRFVLKAGQPRRNFAIENVHPAPEMRG